MWRDIGLVALCAVGAVFVISASFLAIHLLACHVARRNKQPRRKPPLRKRRAWNRKRRPRVSKAERNARGVLGIPANHPERVTGRHLAAEQGDFPQWARELSASGIEAWAIIDAHRRRQ